MVSSSAGAAAAPEELAPRPVGAMPEALTGNGVIHCIQTVEFSAVGDPQCGQFMDVTAGDTGSQYTVFPLSTGSLLPSHWSSPRWVHHRSSQTFLSLPKSNSKKDNMTARKSGS